MSINQDLDEAKFRLTCVYNNRSSFSNEEYANLELSMHHLDNLIKLRSERNAKTCQINHSY